MLPAPSFLGFVRRLFGRGFQFFRAMTTAAPIEAAQKRLISPSMFCWDAIPPEAPAPTSLRGHGDTNCGNN